jgi:hypothetical protein
VTRPWLLSLTPLDIGGYEAAIQLPDLRTVRVIVAADQLERFDAAAIGEAMAAALPRVSATFRQSL